MPRPIVSIRPGSPVLKFHFELTRCCLHLSKDNWYYYGDLSVTPIIISDQRTFNGIRLSFCYSNR